MPFKHWWVTKTIRLCPDIIEFQYVSFLTVQMDWVPTVTGQVCYFKPAWCENIKQYSSQTLSLDVLGLSENSKPCSSLCGPTHNLMQRSLCCDAKPECGSRAKLSSSSPWAVRITTQQKQLVKTHTGMIKCLVMPTRKGFYCKVMHVHAQPLNTHWLYQLLSKWHKIKDRCQ